MRISRGADSHAERERISRVSRISGSHRTPSANSSERFRKALSTLSPKRKVRNRLEDLLRDSTATPAVSWRGTYMNAAEAAVIAMSLKARLVPVVYHADRITELDLQDCGLDVNAAQALAGGLSTLPFLESLSLRNNPLSASGVAAVMEALCNSLQMLHWDHASNSEPFPHEDTTRSPTLDSPTCTTPQQQRGDARGSFCDIGGGTPIPMNSSGGLGGVSPGGRFDATDAATSWRQRRDDWADNVSVADSDDGRRSVPSRRSSFTLPVSLIDPSKQPTKMRLQRSALKRLNLCNTMLAFDDASTAVQFNTTTRSLSGGGQQQQLLSSADMDAQVAAGAGITREGLDALGRYLSEPQCSLQRLNLSKNRVAASIADSFLTGLKNCSSLRSLSIAGSGSPLLALNVIGKACGYSPALVRAITGAPQQPSDPAPAPRWFDTPGMHKVNASGCALGEQSWAVDGIGALLRQAELTLNAIRQVLQKQSSSSSDGDAPAVVFQKVVDSDGCTCTVDFVEIDFAPRRRPGSATSHAPESRASRGGGPAVAGEKAPVSRSQSFHRPSTSGSLREIERIASEAPAPSATAEDAFDVVLLADGTFHISELPTSEVSDDDAVLRTQSTATSNHRMEAPSRLSHTRGTEAPTQQQSFSLGTAAVSRQSLSRGGTACTTHKADSPTGTYNLGIICSPRIRVLKLRSNGISSIVLDAGVVEQDEGGHNSALAKYIPREETYGGNSEYDDCFHPAAPVSSMLRNLLRGVRGSSSLLSLDLGANPLGVEGAKLLADALRDHRTRLASLSVDACGLTHGGRDHSGVSDILSALQLQNSSIEELNLSGTPFASHKLQFTNSPTSSPLILATCNVLRENVTLLRVSLRGCWLDHTASRLLKSSLLLHPFGVPHRHVIVEVLTAWIGRGLLARRTSACAPSADAGAGSGIAISATHHDGARSTYRPAAARPSTAALARAVLSTPSLPLRRVYNAVAHVGPVLPLQVNAESMSVRATIDEFLESTKPEWLRIADAEEHAVAALAASTAVARGYTIAAFYTAHERAHASQTGSRGSLEPAMHGKEGADGTGTQPHHLLSSPSPWTLALPWATTTTTVAPAAAATAALTEMTGRRSPQMSWTASSTSPSRAPSNNSNTTSRSRATVKARPSAEAAAVVDAGELNALASASSAATVLLPQSTLWSGSSSSGGLGFDTPSASHAHLQEEQAAGELVPGGSVLMAALAPTPAVNEPEPIARTVIENLLVISIAGAGQSRVLLPRLPLDALPYFRGPAPRDAAFGKLLAAEAAVGLRKHRSQTPNPHACETSAPLSERYDPEIDGPRNSKAGENKGSDDACAYPAAALAAATHSGSYGAVITATTTTRAEMNAMRPHGDNDHTSTPLASFNAPSNARVDSRDRPRTGPAEAVTLLLLAARTPGMQVSEEDIAHAAMIHTAAAALRGYSSEGSMITVPPTRDGATGQSSHITVSRGTTAASTRDGTAAPGGFVDTALMLSGAADARRLLARSDTPHEQLFNEFPGLYSRLSSRSDAQKMTIPAGHVPVRAQASQYSFHSAANDISPSTTTTRFPVFSEITLRGRVLQLVLEFAAEPRVVEL